MKKLFGMLVICAVLIQSAAWASERPGPKHRGPDRKEMVRFYMKLQEALKLTDQQIRDLQARNFSFQREAVKERAALQSAMIDLREIRTQDPVDMKKAESKIRQIADIQADIRIARMKHVESAKNVLTEEQKKTLRNMKKRPLMLRTMADEFPADEVLSGLSPDELDEITFMEDVFELSYVKEPEE